MAEGILLRAAVLGRQGLASRYSRVDQTKSDQAQAAHGQRGLYRRGPQAAERQDSEKSHEGVGQEGRGTGQGWEYDNSESSNERGGDGDGQVNLPSAAYS